MKNHILANSTGDRRSSGGVMGGNWGVIGWIIGGRVLFLNSHKVDEIAEFNDSKFILFSVQLNRRCPFFWHCSLTSGPVLSSQDTITFSLILSKIFDFKKSLTGHSVVGYSQLATGSSGWLQVF